MVIISRLGVRAKPANNHPQFKEWEIANVVILVTAANRDETLALGREVLRREKWELLEVQICDRLIEERVREQGGAMLEAYESAVATGSVIRVFPNNFAPGKAGIPAILPMRITESFVDQVVADIGGERIPTDDETRTVDYLIGDWLFELKDLQEEGLQQPERQKKLHKLFSRFAVPGLPVQINPSVLDENERREFFSILSSPIQPQVKKASKQVRSTRGLLNRNELKGGIIYLNTGYGSFAPEEFGPLVERYVRKDTTQIEAIFCVALWNQTNGFDSYVFFRAYPERPSIPVVSQLQEAFGNRFEEAMTQLVLGTLPATSVFADPLVPITFSVGGVEYVWQPGLVPLKLNDGPH
ncbi:MAG: hypothetical protein SGJ20_02290 [Planctomycetota bacterium]|nr:hypothetical protein [Planctomycetota bacterium]